MPLNRRQFLKSLPALTAGGAASAETPALRWGARPLWLLPFVYSPMIANRASNAGGLGKVLQVYAPQVTDWYFNEETYYGSTQAAGVPGVSQPVVDAMLDRGVTALFGLPRVRFGEAWRRLTPDYVPGVRVAIKINLNNSFDCESIPPPSTPRPAGQRRGARPAQRGVRQEHIIVTTRSASSRSESIRSWLIWASRSTTASCSTTPPRFPATTRMPRCSFSRRAAASLLCACAMP